MKKSKKLAFSIAVLAIFAVGSAYASGMCPDSYFCKLWPGTSFCLECNEM